MTRPAFLTRPYDWTITRRTTQTPVDYACAVQHNVPPRKGTHPAERFFLPLLIVIVVLLAWGWL